MFYVDSDNSSNEFDEEYDNNPLFIPIRHVDFDHPKREEDVKEDKTNEEISHQTRSLLDTAARVTALNYTCDQLDDQPKHLDGLMFKKIAFWAFPENLDKVKAYVRIYTLKWEKKWKKGEQLSGDSNIQDIRQVGFMLSSDVKEMSGNHSNKHMISRVTLTFELQRITSTKCTSCVNKVWCHHVIATVIYRIKYPQKVQVYEPITETLSNLKRDQLQKLLQYAVNKDPSALLPVYQCIDDIQDRNSEVNKQEGAPDPSFGLGDEMQKMTQKSLDKLQKQFKKELRLRGYVEEFSMIQQRKDSFIYQKFIKRILEMMSLHDTDTAGQVLLAFIRVIHQLQVMYSENEEDFDNLDFLQWDMELLCSCYILTAVGEVRSEVIRAVTDINSVSNVTRVSDARPSIWTNLLSVSLHDSVTFPNDGAITASNTFKTAPYYHSICASLIPHTTKSLDQLLAGTVSPLDTIYDEPVPVMLLRFESLVQFSCPDSRDKIHLFGIVLLRKLLKVSAQYSLVSNISFEDTVKEVENDGPSQPKKCRYSEDTDRDSSTETGLSEEQLFFSLLHVCYQLLLKVFDVDCRPNYSVVIHATLRSMEFFRFVLPIFNTLQNFPDYDELSWLYHMVSEVKCQLLMVPHNRDLIGRICGEYISALRNNVVVCEEMSIELYSTLVEEVQKYGGNREAVVTMCTRAICCMTELLRISFDEYDDFEFEHDVNCKSWCEVINFVLASKSKISHALYDHAFTKIVSHFLKIKDDEFMTVVVQCITQCNHTDIMPEHRLLLTRLQIYLLKEFNWQFKDDAVDVLFALVDHFEEPCWCQLLSNWRAIVSYFNKNELTMLIGKLADTMSKLAFLPPKLYECLLQYFEGEFEHKDESFDLYKIFKYEFEREKVLEKISTNYKNYNEFVLLRIALDYHVVTGFQILFHGDIFSRHTLLMIQQALHMFRNALSSSARKQEFADLLQKLFELIAKAGNEHVSRGNQFSVLMEEISNTLKDDMQILVDFFKAMEQNTHMLEKAKTKLGMELITRCREYFLKHMFPFTLGLDYRKKLSEAKIQCIMYVNHGAAIFDEQVTSVLKDKLLIGQETSDILHLIDTIIPEGSSKD